MGLKEKVRVSGNTVYEIDKIESAPGVLRITFAETVNLGAVITNMAAFGDLEILTRSDDVCGEYSGYDTIVQVYGRSVTFSNGGAA